MNFNHYNFILKNIPSKIMISSISSFLRSTTNKYKASTIFFAGCGVSISSYYIASYMINKRKDYENNMKETLSKSVEEPYENKYYDAFDKLDSKELSEEYIKSLVNSIIYEPTSKGNIIMYYDHSNESFAYYCDTKDIPYLYLETVARKYVLTNKCKYLLVDIKKELQLANDKQIKYEENMNSNKNKNNENNTIFASFKKYNKKGGSNSTGAKNDSKKMNKKVVICENANRYSYKGKVNEFNFIKKNESMINKSSDTMDYKTFKNLMELKK